MSQMDIYEKVNESEDMFIRQNLKKFGNKWLGGHISPPPSRIGLILIA